MQKERDQQIELVISRLSEESEEHEKKAFEKYQKKLEDMSVHKTSEQSNLQRKIKVYETQIENLKKRFTI